MVTTVPEPRRAQHLAAATSPSSSPTHQSSGSASAETKAAMGLPHRSRCVCVFPLLSLPCPAHEVMIDSVMWEEEGTI